MNTYVEIESSKPIKFHAKTKGSNDAQICLIFLFAHDHMKWDNNDIKTEKEWKNGENIKREEEEINGAHTHSYNKISKCDKCALKKSEMWKEKKWIDKKRYEKSLFATVPQSFIFIFTLCVNENVKNTRLITSKAEQSKSKKEMHDNCLQMSRSIIKHRKEDTKNCINVEWQLDGNKSNK